MPIYPQKNQIYESISMLHPNGDFMCHVSRKRANWYVNKKLAIWLNSHEFKLNFEPNGYGNKHIPYYNQRLENRCVVCGADSDDSLNKHHVVPYVFRSRFPLNFKESNHHDVLIVCVECHKAYETKANILKDEMVKNAGLEVNYKLTDEEKYNNLILANKDLLNKINNGIIKNVPLERIEQIRTIANREFKETGIEDRPHWADFIVKSVINENRLEEFIKFWRKHFLDTMQPKFLPKHWSVEHQIEK